MKQINLFLVCFILLRHYGICEFVFPKEFKFGVTTSAYQTEGGWNESDKGENIWDRLTHFHPEFIADHTTGDVACDSYHQWRTDIEMLKDLGVDHYRFSLSWSRILPTGMSNRISSDGVNHYNNIINSLIDNGILPVVTIYHWDLPQKLQDLGGWANPVMADYFAEFAKIVFQQFGDRVKLWITINEPGNICGSYNKMGAPEIFSPALGEYLCVPTLLRAHAKAYHIYDKLFRKAQNGRIGFSLDSLWSEPGTNRKEDIDAAERDMQLFLGLWAHPILSKNGDYPEIIKSRIQNRSLLENYPESRLPALSEYDIQQLKGSMDFFALNHYTTCFVYSREYPIGEPSKESDMGVYRYIDPNFKPNIDTVPWGFYKLLKWIKKEFDNPLVFITENGYGDDGKLNDEDRIYYLREYLKALLKARNEGCNIEAYTVWTLMDAMEWTNGYTYVLQGQ